MPIKKKLINFKKLANFDTALQEGNILSTSIVFIDDTLKIWTHGVYFSSLKEVLDKYSELSQTITDEATNGKKYVDDQIGTLDSEINVVKTDLATETSERKSKDSALESKIDTETSRAQEAEANRYTKNETYTKEEVNNLITTPNQEYVSVNATEQTTVVTDVLPATGAADTTYRVGNWDGTQYNDSVFSEYAWNGSAYIKLSTKSQIGEVYDISANHADTKYADLATALGTNGKNIPQSLRKGGMSIKFVQTSDNKYVQYRYMSTDVTTAATFTNTANWQGVDDEPTAGSDNLVKSRGIASTYGSYTENPEFVYVKTDREGRVLWAIKTDGSVYYGAGIPQQVIDYVEKKIADLSLDEYEDIVTFLNDLEEGDKTLQALLNEKVDKEEGKSLINAEYAEGVHYVESPEFAEIKVDAEQRILEATYKDGTKIFPAGFRVNGVAEYGGATVTTITNPEFTAVWLDNSNRILLGIKNNADIFLGYGVPSQIKTYIDEEINKVSPESVHELIDFIGEYLGSATLQGLLDKKVDGEYTENTEYIEAKVDSNDKIIEATREDGTKVLPAGIETSKANLKGATIENNANPEYVEVKVDTEDKLVEGTKTDGTKVVGGNLEVGNNLNVKGDVEVEGNVSYKNGIPQAIIDYVAANTGSGITNIEYEDETGDMYATFEDADGVTDVYMDENGDIYAEIDE